MLKHASRERACTFIAFLRRTPTLLALVLLFGAPEVQARDAHAREAKADEHFARDVNPEATERLFTAVERNDLAGVQKAVAEGGDLAAKNVTGRTPADIAVDKGFYPIAQFLLAVRSFQEKDKSHKPPGEVVQELTKDQPKPRAASGPVPLQRGRDASRPATPPASPPVASAPAAPPPPPGAAPKPPSLLAIPADKPKDDDRPRSRYFAGLSSFDPTPRAARRHRKSRPTRAAGGLASRPASASQVPEARRRQSPRAARLQRPWQTPIRLPA